MKQSILEKLTKEFKESGKLNTLPNQLEGYDRDATEFIAPVSAVFMAQTRDDVIAAVKFCHEHSIPITARGAGTGLSGGCVPAPDALVLSTENVRHLKINIEAKTALCGPGVITRELMDAAKLEKLYYPPDPASFEESTLGGNVAEGAGGLRCKRFGVTKDYVLGIEAVLADGSVIRTGSLGGKQSFPINDLFIASEGTLAIITDIEFRLIEPTQTGCTILASFSTPKDAAQTVSDITSSGIIPTVMEFLDGDAVSCVNEYEKIDGLENAAGLLLMETSDGIDGNQVDRIKQFCEKNNSSLLRIENDPDKIERLWKVRRNLSHATKEIAGYRISEDVVVPNSKFPDLVDFVADLNKESSIRINSYGHAGDGNLHVNFLASSGTPEVLAEVEKGIEKLVEITLSLGGTLTGEHGVGLAKKMFINREFDPPTIRAMLAFKEIFDPSGILNPDKIFPQ